MEYLSFVEPLERFGEIFEFCEELSDVQGTELPLHFDQEPLSFQSTFNSDIWEIKTEWIMNISVIIYGWVVVIVWF